MDFAHLSKEDYFMIWIDAMIKDGESVPLQISRAMLPILSSSIQEKGVETIHTTSKTLEIVGFIVRGKQTGKRIIILPENEERVRQT